MIKTSPKIEFRDSSIEKIKIPDLEFSYQDKEDKIRHRDRIFIPFNVAKKPLPKDWTPKYINGNVIDITPLIDDPWWKIETPTSNDDEASAPNGPPFMWEGI